MNFWAKRGADSPILVRVVPFALFLVLTSLQGQWGESSRYWIYLLKTMAGAYVLWSLRSLLPEMKWNLSWEAIAAGILVCLIWVGLDGFYPKLGAAGTPWNPHTQFGQNSGMAWLFIVTRILGSSLVVPLLEEVFFRSFLYRYLINQEFRGVPMNRIAWGAFLIAALVFGFEHYQWLPGILCGFIYQGLVIRKNRLGDAITAHAITNFLLGLWVVTQSAWRFW